MIESDWYQVLSVAMRAPYAEEWSSRIETVLTDVLDALEDGHRHDDGHHDVQSVLADARGTAWLRLALADSERL